MKKKIRLNHFLSENGITSRRKADDLIKLGTVEVNGKLVLKLGCKINYDDIVKFNGVRVKYKKKIYLLINKPKGYITTTKDKFRRKTVMDLIPYFFYKKYRIFPIGRLDRSTTGILIFTNDGDLSEKLTHPKYRVQKVYSVLLNKRISSKDLEKIKHGRIYLKEGRVKVLFIKLIKYNKIEIGIHFGWNKIIIRMFKFLNYNIIRLDRISFGGITKKNVKLGNWRFLKNKEIKYIKTKKNKSL